MPKRLGYIRTSTDEQLTDRQVIKLKKVCDQIFIEDGVSAVSKARPVYGAVIRKLKKGDTLVVSSIDRAFRSALDALTELDKLHRRGVQFESLAQTLDTTTPDGKFLYTLAAALAAWERDILSQRTKEGLAAAKKRGKTLGRPRKLTSEQIAEARHLLKSGHSKSVGDLASAWNVHVRTLIRALQE